MELKDDLRGKKIAVGLSGGVDSSVAALLLARAGYDVFALFMQNWHDVTGTLHGECEWEEDRKVAEMVARKIGIPFEFIDLSDTYRHRVVDYMFSEYSKGRTPNPDVLCNSEIKFDAFLKAARDLGADYVATGHYCRKDVTAGPDGQPVYRILAGADGNKDQSYFLCQLTQEQLSAALFPIGDIVKPEVRRLAREAGLPSAEKKDSQGICFVGKVDLPVFLQQKLASREGNVVEIFRDFYDNIRAEYPGYTAATSEPDAADITALGPSEVRALARAYHYRESDGRKIGTHIGAQYYTIGQRKGLNIGGHREPIFILDTSIATNTIYVGEGHEHPGLMRKALKINADEVHWIRRDLRMAPGEVRRCLVRVRYRQPLQQAALHCLDDGMYIVFEEPQRGITPGQFAVWYAPQDLEMLGSGVISE
ncbi:MAG TPA: tRNA 2-thiouridine(34) synthase MnmA [Candidatus Coprenecus avistercoris]|uniref:tRNA-specific 2-thiouridylase MnmA n=1 Tax=Candidatus Coprenecus avistercoris TaxID=2840730 RepID=A0A9D1E1H9_9BACT|nr:tRNA 2-thiouridine(34) synthase MnmA [Candidatus Coprenecus avistercoris]